jgi:hypothetical protein
VLQLLILAIALICALAGLVTIAKGRFSITSGHVLRGTSARIAGIVLLLAAGGVAYYGFYVFPKAGFIRFFGGWFG